MRMTPSYANLFMGFLEQDFLHSAVPAESYVIHLSSASLVSCDVYGQ